MNKWLKSHEVKNYLIGIQVKHQQDLECQQCIVKQMWHFNNKKHNHEEALYFPSITLANTQKNNKINGPTSNHWFLYIHEYLSELLVEVLKKYNETIEGNDVLVSEYSKGKVIDIVKDTLRPNDVLGYKKGVSLTKVLKVLYKEYNNVLSEKGINPLYLSCGLVEMYSW